MKDISIIKNENILEIVLEVAKKLENIFKNRLKNVILYGSYARGNYNKESDIDVMALVDISNEELSKYYGIVVDAIFDLEIEHGIIISVIKKNYQDYNKYLNILPFYKNVYNEGINIYGRN
ncbi:DNA polymerase subunit beta [Candidatus Desantisbacteria bacterium CG_4_8_14_3_um_filter_40_12]|uniref:DNA polymerase subunit beta n=2 Tax=unclassified Candidatus Desantisiibacteriota TaxID=3106372 RepID=A0A2M7JDV0_9BACT|nr:MAG: DNA polymerase subunit beta [Candidatus Desantisbacteria bacterium CG23_combo_of_CG06-09_8_20_14_all_40_23]PIX17589.1 MAG: DNA polymerase subunit beta [Candidatus Desantisbacteria bacterium CG_4_8_14_3_um_filter_40_12]